MKLTKEFLRKLIKEELEKATLSEARFAVYAGRLGSNSPPIKILDSMEAAEAAKEELYKQAPYSTSQNFQPGGRWALTVGPYAEKTTQSDAGGPVKHWVSIGAGRWDGPFDSHSEASRQYDRGIIRTFKAGIDPNSK